MKKIKFTCPHCNSVLRVPGHLAGVSGPCPKCATTITAPTESERSHVEEIPARNGSALAAAITGSGGGTVTATMPPPVQTIQEQPVVHARVEEPVVVEAKTQVPQYVPEPPVREMAPPAPVEPEPYAVLANPITESAGSYAEPILPVHERVVAEPVAPPVVAEEIPPVSEPMREVVAAPVDPSVVEEIVEQPVAPVPEVVAPIAPPIVQEVIEAPVVPVQQISEPIIAPPVLEEIPPQIPIDIVEADIHAPVVELEAPNLDTLVVEEPVLPPPPAVVEIPAPEPPPAPEIAVPKTQPIKIKQPSVVLAPDHAEAGAVLSPYPVQAPAAELPRLDVSLAESDIAGGLQQFQETEPKRIQLSPLGEEGVEPMSLDDFTVISEETEPIIPVMEPVPLAPIVSAPEPNTESIPLPLENNLEYAPPLDAGVSASVLEQQLIHDLEVRPDVHEPAPLEDLEFEFEAPFPELEVEEAVLGVPEVVAPEPEITLPVLEVEEQAYYEPVPLIEQPQLAEPEEIVPSDQGSMANMLSPVEPQVESPLSSELGFEPVPQSEIQPTLPVEEPVPAPLSPVPQDENSGEMDLFDELLGRSSSNGKVGVSIFKYGIIVASLAVIGLGLGWFIYRSFGGGLNEYEVLDEKELNQKYSIISSGQSTEGKAKSKEVLDMSLPSKIDVDNIDPVKTEDIPVKAQTAPPITPVSDDGGVSSITLPGDGNRVRISDGSAGPRSVSEAPATEVKNAGVQAYNERIGSGSDKMAALDETIKGIASETPEVIDSPAIRDIPARVMPKDAPALPAATSTGDDFSGGFPAPSKEDPPLGLTRELVEAFVRAEDWESRIPLTYQGDSLRPLIEDYYKKWPFTRSDRFSVNLFEHEPNKSSGGPYWVYMVSKSDADAGIPVIVRSENGMLKVDWESYSEFQDKHFAGFQDGAIASPHSFRVVLEQKSAYFGPDRDGFTDKDDYLCFEISPPYGDVGEYSQIAFVKKGTPLASMLSEKVVLGGDILAVMLTLDYKAFPHGIKHMVITKWVTEGWFE